MGRRLLAVQRFNRIVLRLAWHGRRTQLWNGVHPVRNKLRQRVVALRIIASSDSESDSGFYWPPELAEAWANRRD